MNDRNSSSSQTGGDQERASRESAAKIAEDLKRRAGNEVNEYMEKARGYMGDMASRFQDERQRLKGQAREMKQRTDEYVHENPWSAIAMAAVVGALMALLFSQRRKD